jgi:predicted polyphosphate/ATP-dependent NAD kinase
MDHRVGFLVNPIAGLGGRVGLKGTDGVADEALRRGAEPRAADRGAEALRALPTSGGKVEWLTVGPPMGEDLLRVHRRGDGVEVVHAPGGPTTAEDTRIAVGRFVDRPVDIILFVGGDGTARDVAEASGGRVPILGVPAGVKMHSSVFAMNPRAAAMALWRFLEGELRVGEGEVLDVDEEAYRRGDWRLAFHGTVPMPVEPTLVQVGKAMVEEVAEEAIKKGMARYLAEMMEADTSAVFLLGPGGTLKSIADHLSLPKTLLGVDAVVGGKVVASDVGEAEILELLRSHGRARIVVSPIGAQGFVFGRGNHQFSPEVIRRVGPSGVVVTATPAKLSMTPVLRVDTGDATLDKELTQRRYLAVVVGYRTQQLHPAE